MSISSKYTNRRLPANQRVLKHLLEELKACREGDRLPSIRDLSVKFDASVPTVQGVFHKLAAEGIIRTEVGRGAFLSLHPSKKRVAGDDALRIGISVSKEEIVGVGHWTSLIYSSVVDAAVWADKPITILPARGSDKKAALLKMIPEIDGLIMFPFSGETGVRDEYEKAMKPTVHINPQLDHLSANYVSADYFASGALIARAWRETGRRRCVFLCVAPLTASPSETASLSGLVCGLGEALGGEVDLRILPASPNSGVEDGFQAMDQFLRAGGSAPDCVYAIGDLLAIGAGKALKARGLRIPEDVSLVGQTGLGLDDPDIPNLTTAKQPFDAIGKNLVALISRRIELGGIDLPSVSLPVNFVGGGTTRAQENCIFGISR